MTRGCRYVFHLFRRKDTGYLAINGRITEILYRPVLKLPAPQTNNRSYYPCDHVHNRLVVVLLRRDLMLFQNVEVAQYALLGVFQREFVLGEQRSHFQHALAVVVRFLLPLALLQFLDVVHVLVFLLKAPVGEGLAGRLGTTTGVTKCATRTRTRASDL